jgi:transcriptional regulator with XRE-family HTH domain
VHKALVNDIEEGDPSEFSRSVGRRLRAVRRARGQSLDEVERASGGRWSASAVGAYERGFRNLTVPRLRELASFYDVPMVALLGEPEVEEGGDRPAKVVLDLQAVNRAEGSEAIARYLKAIILDRGDFNGRVLSIRRDDIRVLCALQHATEAELFDLLQSWGALVAGWSAGDDDDDEIDGNGGDNGDNGHERRSRFE